MSSGSSGRELRSLLYLLVLSLCWKYSFVKLRLISRILRLYNSSCGRLGMEMEGSAIRLFIRVHVPSTD